MKLKILVLILGLTMLGNAHAGKGWALCIGVNKVDAGSYDDMTLKELRTCENDACQMYNFAKQHGLEGSLLPGRQATRKAVTDAIKTLATQANSGDLVLISYSGHGGRVPDRNGDEKTDETWCLYDGQLIDDNLAQLWVQFKEGVRILLISDSCFSGTINKALLPVAAPGLTSKALDDDAQKRMTQKYEKEWSALPRSDVTLKSLKATLLLLAACKETEEAYIAKNDDNSIYTKHLLAVGKEKEFTTSYNVLIAKVAQEVSKEVKNRSGSQLRQTPTIQKDGTGVEIFSQQKVCEL